MTNLLLIPASEGGYVARDLVTGTTSQGENIAEALANLNEAVALYRDVFPTPKDLTQE